jgi:hypothetical protein
MRQSCKNLSCEKFQAQLLDLMVSGEGIANHPHLLTCELCRDLLADLEAIAQAARQLFYFEEPREALWSNIHSAIVHEQAAQGR